MVNFPPVTVLLRGCLPFQDGEDLLLKLAATWGEAVGCTGVSIARWAADIAHLEIFSRVNGQEWDEFEVTHTWLPVGQGIEQAAELALQSFPKNGRTLDLRAAGHVVGWLHLVHPEELNDVPRDWVDQSSRLVLQAGQWSQSLREKKLAALGEYAAGAGHEINNPVGAISGRVQQLLVREQDPERRRLLETIGAQTLRIRDMIGDSMLYARPPAPQFEAVSWWTVWQQTVERLEPQLSAKQLCLTRQGGEVLLHADSTQLAVVCAELLLNSIQASMPGQSLECEVQTSRERAHIVLRDHGAGLTQLEREHLFDPFFSGRQAGRGLGFGLSKAWRIAQQHGGQLLCHPVAGGGVEMHLHWPTMREAT